MTSKHFYLSLNLTRPFNKFITIRILISLSVVSHLVPHFLLNPLQNSRINKLGEGVQLLLMEECHKVVAKSPHLTLSVEERILHYAALRAVNVSLLLDRLFHSLLVCDSLSKCPLADRLLEKHDDECSFLVICNRFVRAWRKEDWHLITFKHDIWKEELQAILKVV